MATGPDRRRHGQSKQPFDLAAVHKIFATFEDAAAKMPTLSPDNTKSEANSPESGKVGFS